MALGIFRVLDEHGEIRQPELAQAFALGYDADPARGYGYGMHQLLPRLLQEPDRWAELARGLFDGEGSLGNGAAMRVAPLGAWFRRDLRLVIAQATLSAEVTHAHPEGIAGAVAVAVAAALSTRWDLNIGTVVEAAPDSAVREGLRRAASLPFTTEPWKAADILGNGQHVRADDTVPLRRLVRRPPPRRPDLGPVDHGGGLRRRRHDLRHHGRHRGRPYGSEARARGLAEPPRGGTRRVLGHSRPQLFQLSSYGSCGVGTGLAAVMSRNGMRPPLTGSSVCLAV